MKKLVSIFCFMLIALSASAQVDHLLGKWQSIDDNDGSAKSIVHIFKATDGKYYGKIEKLLKNADAVCDKCEGANHNKPIAGMVIINKMVIDGNMLKGGTILDPASGKVYNCSISWDEKAKKLKVRGSLDKSGMLGRSQYWVKL